jgi:DNA-binding transcriptional ArsR family regulator
MVLIPFEIDRTQTKEIAMTVTTPRVRDFTAGQRLQLEVAAGDAFELLLALYALGDEEDDLDFEIGADWFTGVRERAGEELLDRIAAYGDWSVWITLVGVAYAMGAPFTAERLIEHLDAMEPVALRSALLEVGACQVETGLTDEDRAALAAGDPAAIEAGGAWSEKCPGLAALMRLPVEETRVELVGILRDFAAADPLPEGAAATLERDADHKRSLARRMDPERLIEKATNGITVSAQPGLDGVVLVPSVIVRPWAIIAERGTTRIICYSVDEEILGSDPDAPPIWLVQFYKALGDERRLTILKRLAEGPASFGELVELLDLAKSTVHHHVRQLRTAGVVRVTVGDDKEYSLRTGTVPEAAHLLEGFLGITHDNP